MKNKKGFTMVELMVVLVVLGVLAAVAVPSLTQYIHLAQFRRNEEYAKTMYLDAESALTYYRTGGEWDDFRRLVMKEGEKNTDGTVGTDERPVYAICLERGEDASAGGDAALVRQLLNPDTYDEGVLDAAICIEVDINAGQVYSVFYSTSCDGLAYDTAGRAGGVWLNLNQRDYETRRAQRLGYYSAVDKTNVVELELTRLRILSISLINSETLTLNWSSNSIHGDLDVAFEITLNNSADNSELWSTVVDRSALEEVNGRKTYLPLKIGGESYSFPLVYEDGRFTLTLDAMMNARLLKTLEGDTEAAKSSSTSVTRLPGCGSPISVYATIKARPTYGEGIGGEYQESARVSSNRANTMFGDSTGGSSYQVSAFRHLSNLRYIEDAGAVFTMPGGSLNWTSDNVLVYGVEGGAAGSLKAKKGSETVFPTVPELKGGQTLTGSEAGAAAWLASLLTGNAEPSSAIANLRLGADSVAEGGKYLGLIGDNKGTIRNLKLTDPEVSVTDTENAELLGAGAFCGRSTGKLSALALRGAATPADGKKNVDVALDGSGNRMGVGGIVGILTGNWTAEGLSAEGTVSGTVPAPADDNTVGRGVAGLIGCVEIDTGGQTLEKCQNRAAVTGNRCVGGIAGWLSDKRNAGIRDETSETHKDSLRGCANQGLILISEESGMYAGGIAGYGLNVWLDSCVSGSGRASGYQFDPSQKENLLLGSYVGGILGRGQSSYLNNCSTEAGGYVLGGTYVGGIVGGLDGDKQQRITTATSEGVSVTVNASYVIGNSYVGGIVGENRGASTIDNCINNGVAVGYGRYIGGICGTNEKDGDDTATIKNCASYLSDTDHRIARLIESWGSTGDCTGGLVGYNSGAIIFDRTADNHVSNQSVSSIVVGENYVGGLVGFNDAGGSIDVDYKLLGGYVSASGDCAGGLVGLNASKELLTKTLEIQPGNVEGRYFVGGAIGANVAALDGETRMEHIRVTNQLGTVSGEAFCGGLLGYHGTVQAGGSVTPDSAGAFLPEIREIDGEKLPVFPADVSTGKLIIAGAEAEPDCKNNMKVRARAYVGGIVGFCNPNSPLLIRNCVNRGDLERLDTPSVTGLDRGVDVAVYLRHVALCPSAADVLDSELGEGTLRACFAGGIVGVNSEKHVIVRCRNSGRMNGFETLGGVVGLNQGVVYDCALERNLGSEVQDCLGGIVGLNVGLEGGGSAGIELDGATWKPGTVGKCSVASGLTVTGRRIVGGIAGYNTVGGLLRNNDCGAYVRGADKVGGMAGENAGGIDLSKPMAYGAAQQVSASSGTAGGVIGVNTEKGVLTVGGAVEEGYPGQPATTKKLTVLGWSTAGGVAGINRGTFHVTEGVYLLNYAAVQARAGSDAAAGGVVGRQEAARQAEGLSLSNAVNLGPVRANSGRAGGVVSYVEEGAAVMHCNNHGNVTCDSGYAGGVAGENAGSIQSCHVSAPAGGKVTLTSVGGEAIGGICAVNRETGHITVSSPGEGVCLDGTAAILGAVAGDNHGTIDNIELTSFPAFSHSGSLTVGGAAGRNRGRVSHIRSGIEMNNLSAVRNLGGVVGSNEGSVTDCSFSGKILEENLQSAAGGCYGGVAGLNQGRLENCALSGFTINATGVYTATSTSTAEEKERLSTHFGGFAGKNDTTGRIEGCLINTNKDAATSAITVSNGMAGGVTGYNKGTILRSGDGSEKGVNTLMAGVNGSGDANALLQKCGEAGLSADANWVNWDWNGNTQVENLTYNTSGAKVSAGRDLTLILSTSGNVGGITGYNAPSGKLDLCVSGNWFIANKSQALGVGTGGIVGMNEGEKGMSCLVNRAFVARQTSSNQTNRFAGGIVGNQINSTTSDWTIRGCVNYGTVYGYRNHYSGGIVGQWSGNGGTIQDCRNYGNLQTTYAAAWIGASGGIVAQLYHATAGQDFNILSCENHGSIYGQTGNNNGNCANDSAGILGNVTTFAATDQNGQSFTINVADCVNGPGVEIYSASMASGIVGFFSADGADKNNGAYISQSTQNVVLNIDRCRNYASTLNGQQFSAGILGDRYGNAAGNTFLQNCFSAYPDQYSGQSGPIIAFANTQNQSTRLAIDNVGNNYYFKDFTWAGTVSGTPIPDKDLQRPPITTAVGTAAREYANAGTRMAGMLRVNGGEHADKCAFALLGEPSPYAGGGGMGDRGGVSKSVTRYKNYSDKNTYVSSEGDLISRGTNSASFTPIKSGHVLFYMPKAYTLDGIKTKGSDFDSLVREYYREYETRFTTSADAGGTEKKKLDAPQSATLGFANGVFAVGITDSNRPLYYEGEVWQNGTCIARGLRFIPRAKTQDAGGNWITRGTFTLEGIKVLEGLTLKVRAVSLFEDTDPSDWAESARHAAGDSVLPAPDVRITLIRNDTGGYVYQYSLNNLADFASYPGWQVKLTIGGIPLTLNGTTTTATLDGKGEQQLTVEAGTAPGSTVTYTAPPPQYISTFTPPDGKPGDGKLSGLTWSLSGSSTEDLTLTANLKAASGTINVPPIYRVELVGVKGGVSKVYASQNVLLSAGADVSANFTGADIQEGFFDKDVTRTLRVWYAESGLGPVYTYAADGASTILNNTGDFGGYYATAGLNFKVLPAPELMESSGVLVREETADGSLSYRFFWDDGKTGGDYADAQYAVRLEGVVSEDFTMNISTDGAYTDKTRNAFTISAEDWNYSTVRLTVTRLGDGTGSVVGLSSTRDYQVRQRLERPQQPSADILDNNDLRYRISWPAIDEVRGDDGTAPACGGYQVWLREEDGTLTELCRADTDPNEPAPTYSAEVDMEDYAGKEVTIYVTALAADGSETYVDSRNGVEYTFTLPERLPAPTLVWSYSWTWARDDSVSAAAFNRGLTVTAKSTNPDSHPAGDSILLLEGLIYDSEHDAENGGTPIAKYALRAMSGSGETHIYSHTLEGLSIEYAGKYAAFRARTSSGSGKVGSKWSDYNIVRLPRVKLAEPITSVGSAATTWPVLVPNDNPALPGTAESWTFQFTTVAWAPVEQARVYELTLDGKKFRITVDALGHVTVTQIDGDTATPVEPNENGDYVLASVPEQKGTYQVGEKRAAFTYDAATLLTVRDGGFVLTLPNCSSIQTADGGKAEAENSVRVESVTIQAVVPEDSADAERYDPSGEKNHTF